MDINNIILKILDDKASKEEYEQLKQWKSDSEINIENMKDYSDLWKSADQLKNYKSFESNKAWNEIKPNLGSEYKWIGYALILTAGVIIASLIFNSFSKKETTPIHFESTEEVMQFALEDKTNIWLNRNSTVEQMSDFNIERVVNLKGQAYFDVSKIENSNFIVDLGTNGKIQVLGTEFSVLSEDDNLEIFVNEGHVQYLNESKEINLSAGDALKKLKDESLVKYKLSDVNYLSWKDKVLKFDNTLLPEVLDQIARSFSKEIEISQDLQNLDCRLNSQFTDQSYESILEELGKLFGLKYNFKNDKFHFYYAKC